METTNGHGFLYNGSTWTTLDDPLEVNGFGALAPGCYGISGTNIVGCYEGTFDLYHGFLYNGSTWTTLDDPLGVNGTIAQGISGTKIVGCYANNGTHGFLATPAWCDPVKTGQVFM